MKIVQIEKVQKLKVCYLKIMLIDRSNIVTEESLSYKTFWCKFTYYFFKARSFLFNFVAYNDQVFQLTKSNEHNYSKIVVLILFEILTFHVRAFVIRAFCVAPCRNYQEPVLSDFYETNLLHLFVSKTISSLYTIFPIAVKRSSLQKRVSKFAPKKC